MMFEDIVANAPFCIQIFNILTYVKDGMFVLQKLSKQQKDAFVQAVRNVVDPDYV